MQGSEKINFSLNSVVLCQVFEPIIFEESKGKLELEAAMKVKYDA